MSATTPPRAPVPIAVIGAGGWGQNIVRTLAALEGAELRWICDVRPEVLEGHRKRFPGVRTTPDLAEVLRDEGVRAIAVAVPAARHHAVARECLRAGRHTFVEKPLTLAVADAEALVAEAARAKVRLMVGHLLLYHPAVLKMRELVDRGELGDVLYCYSQRLNLGIVRRDENAWWSLAPHDLSVAQFLLGGRPVAVGATGQCFLQRALGVEDVVFATVTFDNGRLAHIHASWLDPHKERRLTLVGTKKMAVFDDMEPSEKLRVYDKGAEVGDRYVDFATAVRLRVGDVWLPAIPAVEPLQAELKHFVDAVATGGAVRTDGASGADVVRVLVAGQESLRRGGAVVPVGAAT